MAFNDDPIEHAQLPSHQFILENLDLLDSLFDQEKNQSKTTH